MKAFSSVWLVFAALAVNASAATPVLLSISPETTLAGTGAVTLTVNGANFESGVRVRVNDAVHTTTFVSSSKLTATILGSETSTPRTLTITVANPGNFVSSALQFQVLDNAPQISAIDPDPAAVNQTTVITVIGQNFGTASVVRVNSVARDTTFVDSTHLKARLTTADVNTPRQLSITVLNPNGHLSLPFTLNVIVAPNPPPSISLLQPASVVAGNGAFTLSVVGSNFVSGAKASLNGSVRKTTFVDAQHLNVDVFGFDVVTAGNVSVTVANPDAQVSGTATLRVTSGPIPTITTISPSTVDAGSASFTLNITGTNFVSGTTVNVGDSTPRIAQFISATHLSTDILAPEVATPGSLKISVTTPGSTGSTSNEVMLLVVDPNAPTVTSINPSSVAAGSPSFRLLVTGTKFVDGDIIQFGGVAHPTEFINSTSLATTITSVDVATPGVFDVTVTRFDHSATSAPVSLTVTSPTAPAITELNPATAQVGDPPLTLSVIGRNFESTSVITIDDVPRATDFVSDTELHTALTADDQATVRSLHIAVVNPGGVTSAVVLLPVNLVKPVITAITPAQVIAGDAGFQLTVSGTNIDATSVISIDGTPQTTTFQSGTLLTTIRADQILQFGNLDVRVTTNGVTSAASPLTVRRPVITSLSRTVFTIGEGPVTVTIRGQAFLPFSTVIFLGVQQPTVANADGSLTATIDMSASILTPGPYGISVRNTPFATSTPFFVDVVASGTPRIDSITPSTVALGTFPELRITGANFLATSVVRVNGTARATTFISATELRIVLGTADTANAGELRITVANPDGLVSPEAVVTVGAPLPPGVRRRSAPH